MKYGKNYKEFKTESSEEGGGNFIRSLKSGDTEVVFLTESGGWVGYKEHYNTNPDKYGFPCTKEADCPGCTSGDPKMAQRLNKVAIPVLVDEKWVNVYRIPASFADRLERRADRRDPPTIRDRSWILTKEGEGFGTTYDVEAGEKVFPDDYDKWEVPDIEQMLKIMFEEAWGDADPVQADKPKTTVKAGTKAKTTTTEVDEAELRSMQPRELKKFLRAEGYELPDEIAELSNTDKIVDWVLEPPF